MKIIGLALTVHQLPELRRFYTATLGLSVVEETDALLALQIGRTKLVFTVAEQTAPSHYIGFHVPDAQMERARSWAASLPQSARPRVGAEIAGSAADGVFVTDPAGNLVGMVPTHAVAPGARMDGRVPMLGVGEIGILADNVPDIVQALERQFGFTPYPPGGEGRAAVGDEHGVFVVLRRGQARWAAEQSAGEDAVIMTIEGEANAVDRIADLPYYVHIARVGVASRESRVARQK